MTQPDTNMPSDSRQEPGTESEDSLAEAPLGVDEKSQEIIAELMLSLKDAEARARAEIASRERLEARLETALAQLRAEAGDSDVRTAMALAQESEKRAQESKDTAERLRRELIAVGQTLGHVRVELAAAEARAGKLEEMLRGPRSPAAEDAERSLPPVPAERPTDSEIPHRLKVINDAEDVADAIVEPARFQAVTHRVRRVVHSAKVRLTDYFCCCPYCRSVEVYATNRHGQFLVSHQQRSWIAQKFYCERCTKHYRRPGRLFRMPKPLLRPPDLYD